MRSATILLIALLVLATPSHADRQTAKFFSSRADTALKAGNWTLAEEEYRRALKEDATFLPARYGLSQALLGRGDGKAALEELKAFLSAVKGDPDSPAKWTALAAKAQKQLEEMDASGAALRKIVDRYAASLLLLARRWVTKDPATAQRAAVRVLEIRPGDKQAEEFLARLEDVKKGPPVELFPAADLGKWEPLEFPHWQVLGGNLVGDARGGSRKLRSVASFKGDYDLTVEARILEDRTGLDFAMHAMAAWKGEKDFIGIGLINRKAYFVEWNSRSDKRIHFKLPLDQWKASYDPTQWATYELRFRKETITALINGTVVAEVPRSERRRDGFVGVIVQNGKVAFRKVEVQRR